MERAGGRGMGVGGWGDRGGAVTGAGNLDEGGEVDWGIWIARRASVKPVGRW